MLRRVGVTGAAGALGVEVVKYFLDAGDHVVALDLTDKLLEESIGRSTQRCTLTAVDLTSRASCRKVLSDNIEKIGGFDVFCNIAGGFHFGEQVHEATDETWDFLFNLNAKAIMHTAAVVIPAMIKQGQGKWVNVAAIAADRGDAMVGVYSASKASVRRLTESMSDELREHDINVNCVQPSLIDTPRNRQDMPDQDPTNWVKPEEVAAVVGFLASQDANAIHGASIPVRGKV